MSRFVTGDVPVDPKPVILSASRATDIPAFHAEWFLQRLREGFVDWTNPFNRKVQRVSFENTRAIVFWTKNPAPMFPLLDELDAMGYSYYFTYTVNDYKKEDIEPGLPPLPERLESFVTLSRRLGKARVVWRFDPMLLGGGVTVDGLLRRVQTVGGALSSYTEKLVFSFVDIQAYRKVRRRWPGTGNDAIREITRWEMRELGKELQVLNQKWHIEMASCAEEEDLSEFEIGHNHCVDGNLLAKCFPEDSTLMEHLGLNQTDLFAPEGMDSKTPIGGKDKGQRKYCRCIASKDIGSYGTCRHGCKYCYANN